MFMPPGALRLLSALHATAAPMMAAAIQRLGHRLPSAPDLDPLRVAAARHLAALYRPQMPSSAPTAPAVHHSTKGARPCR